MIQLHSLLWSLCLALMLLTSASAQLQSRDVIVYGGTSGGVTAAVQVARSGKSVILISPTSHLGGLTTSGLGWTDLGNTAILGGISKEFYQKVYQHYQDNAAWNWQTKASFGNAGQGAPAFDSATGLGSVFEPKVAESIFNSMISTAGVEVVFGQLDLSSGVVMSGNRIQKIRLVDGREYAGKMFIDTSYEGDLLPGAGVTFTVGREANATYAETYNGLQNARATKNQLPDGIDPYVIAGNAASGLLPGVEADNATPDGTGDDRLQAYCFRMVLTDVAANRVAIAQPAGYDEADYELLFRAIAAGQTSGFFKLDLMPNRKTDSNNTGGISTDFIGKNYGPGWNWTTLNHPQRQALADQHEQWQRGLIWTLQNHPNVPAGIRSAYANWGLPADEFTDHGNWPWQLYVREARRMISDYVMTQHNASGSQIVPDSVGLAAYSMDSHHVQRHVRNGMVKNEGDVQMGVAQPYPISYRSIIPKRGQCENLFVPWSLSATHMAFGSIRMEPVFMGLAQSAGIAAGLAIDANVAVQDVTYSTLRPALVAANQALGDPVTNAPEVIIDNANASQVTLTGTWSTSFATAGFNGTNYFHDNNELQGTKEVFFRFPATTSGWQRVFLRWTAETNRATNVTVRIVHRDGTATSIVNQRINGAKWNYLGLYQFTGAATEGVKVQNVGANGYVIADAAGISFTGPNDDTDGDGITDLHEAELGLNATVSDAAFIAAAQAHPDFFGLHAPSEIHDLLLPQPAISTSPLRSDFNLLDGTTNVETFQIPLALTSQRKFVRVALKSTPSRLVSELAAGHAQKVVVYGTSLTAGGAWVVQMNTWLSTKYPSLLTVINSGLSGKSSVEGLAQLNTKVIAHQPDVVFIEFAVNDAFRYTDGTPQLDPAQAKANLNAMINAILASKSNTEIILQTTNPAWDSPSGSNASGTLRPNLADFYQAYRDVAKERRLLLVDHFPNWLKLQQQNPTEFQAAVPDGVHPTSAAWTKYVFPLLQWKLSGGQPLP